MAHIHINNMAPANTVVCAPLLKKPQETSICLSGQLFLTVFEQWTASSTVSNQA